MMLENILQWFVWRLPREVVYWCAIRLMTEGAGGNPYNGGPGDRTCDDALKGWKSR